MYMTTAVLPQVPNMHTVTALACSPDSSQIVAGTIMGALDLYRMSSSSRLYRKRYVLQYSLDGSVTVRDMQAGASCLYVSAICLLFRLCSDAHHTAPARCRLAQWLLGVPALMLTCLSAHRAASILSQACTRPGTPSNNSFGSGLK